MAGTPVQKPRLTCDDNVAESAARRFLHRVVATYDEPMLPVVLTFVSLALTVLVGAVFLVGLHRIVTWCVARVEQRSAAGAPPLREQARTYWNGDRRPLRSLPVRRPARR